MEHLTKQQIVLLTLLVSFVTSLATGIITVSLMDQGSLDITQVVNKIEQNVTAAPTPNVTVTAAVAAPTLASITAQVAKSVVRLKPQMGTSSPILGIGVILSKDGLLLTDKAALMAPGDDTPGKNIVAILSTGEEVPIQVIQSEIIGDVAFAVIVVPKQTTLTPVTAAPSLSSIQLGDTVYALSDSQLKPGIISKVGDRLETTIPPQDILVGSPLFNSKGEVVAFKTSALKDTPLFYPLPSLRSITPVLTR